MSPPSRRTLKPTAQLSDYRLLGLVGQGQFAQVYCAIHRHTGHLVAIKQTRHLTAATQEPPILSQLSHPNVVGCEAIFDHCSNQAERDYMLCLEYCEGGTLRTHLTPSRPCPLAETKALIGDVLRGLSHIHQHEIIHGDLKPENILLTYRMPAAESRSLTAKISDFGIACWAERPRPARQEIGSPTYAAPERFDGDMSFASDLYSVGVMLYELLLGDRPFFGNPEMLQQAHKTQPVLLPDTLTRSAKELLATALHKQPSQRFASAEAMLSALQQLPAVQPVPRQAKSSSAALQTISVAPALSPIGTTGQSQVQITDPIEHLLTIPQGCCLITANSLHLLTAQRQLLLLEAFEQAQWSAVSPNGRWCITLLRQSKGREGGQYRALFQADSILSNAAKRPLQFQSAPCDMPSADVVQLLAVDAHHLVKVRSAAHPAQTDLVCFTRRGQFVAQLSLNFSITQTALTAIPYQLVAIAAPTKTTDATVVLITLKPFTVKRLRLPITPRKVSALPWGYLVMGQGQALLLDRFAEPVSRLLDLPADCAITAIGKHTVLLAASSSTAEPSTLFTLDFKHLDLGLIC
ncbi:MAG: serine/threonine-protein kinase [Phormidesmis sp.]